MLALLSSSRDKAIACCRLLKNVTSCFTPSSKTRKSPWSRSVTYRLLPGSTTVTFSETMSTPARKDGRGGSGCWAARTVADNAASGAAATNRRRNMSGSWFPAFRGSARRESGSGHGHSSGLGLDQRLWPAVDHLVLVLQLASELSERGAEAHAAQQRMPLAAAALRPEIEHHPAIA